MGRPGALLPAGRAGCAEEVCARRLHQVHAACGPWRAPAHQRHGALPAGWHSYEPPPHQSCSRRECSAASRSASLTEDSRPASSSTELASPAMPSTLVGEQPGSLAAGGTWQGPAGWEREEGGSGQEEQMVWCPAGLWGRLARVGGAWSCEVCCSKQHQPGESKRVKHAAAGAHPACTRASEACGARAAAGPERCGPTLSAAARRAGRQRFQRAAQRGGSCAHELCVCQRQPAGTACRGACMHAALDAAGGRDKSAATQRTWHPRLPDEP